jgi:DNA polymerase
MTPADAVHLLLAELRRRRSEGVRTVYLAPEGEAALADLLRRARGESAPAVGAPAARRETYRPADPAPRVKAEPLAPKPAAPKAPVVDDSAVPPPPEVVLPAEGSPVDRLSVLAARIRACPECARHLGAGAPSVLGFGDPGASLLVVEEAPEAEDLAAGAPYRGPSGQILAKALGAMGLAPEAVRLTYLMRWRPVMAGGLGDRPPTAREAAFCRPYLLAELGVIRPKAVVVLGNGALNGLMGLEGESALRITRQRGAWLELGGVPVMPTYKPSYLLRNPSPEAKRQFWGDLLAVMERLGLPISERQRGYYAAKPAQRGLSE